jgi:glycogen operon protein
VCVRLAGDRMEEVDERGERIVGETLLLLLNADPEAVTFRLPDAQEGQEWERLLDTDAGHDSGRPRRPAQAYELVGHGLAVFRQAAQRLEEGGGPAAEVIAEARPLAGRA